MLFPGNTKFVYYSSDLNSFPNPFFFFRNLVSAIPLIQELQKEISSFYCLVL